MRLISLGDKYRSQKQYNASIDAYNNSARYYPDFYRPNWHKALVFEDMCKWKDAINEIQMAQNKYIHQYDVEHPDF
jgi:tetratricopeptide (TPR) repeat protein